MRSVCRASGLVQIADTLTDVCFVFILPASGSSQL